MWKMGCFGVVRGHSRLLKIAPFDGKQQFLLASRSNYVAILHRF